MDVPVKMLLLGKTEVVGSEQDKHGSNVAETTLPENNIENNPRVQWNGCSDVDLLLSFWYLY